jgi:hypothetical protein
MYFYQSGNFFGGLLLMAISALLGCSPVYRTAYTYTPPTTADGKLCSMQCENTKIQCEQVADLKAENCRRDAKVEVENCKREGNKYCPEQACPADYGRCLERYHSCFGMCGGRVDAQTACVRHCPKAAVPNGNAGLPPAGASDDGNPPVAAGTGESAPSKACGACGRVGPEGKFCSHCGKSMSAPAKCKCGQAVPAGAQFCSKCGAKVGK